MKTHLIKRREAGFTLVELAISTAIMGLMMGFLLMVQVSGQKAAAQARQNDEVEGRLTRALERAHDETRFVINDLIWEDLSGASTFSKVLTFQSVASLDGGVMTPSDVTRLEVLMEDSEADDGVDNDGDGLIDEGALWLTRDFGGPNEKSVILCKGVTEYYDGEALGNGDDNGNLLVDESGFHVERDEDRLVFRLSVERVKEDGVRTLRSGEASVNVRN